MWWLPQTCGYSYPRVVAIQIDVHPTEEIWSTCHMLSTVDLCMTLDHTYLMRSSYSNLSRSRQQRWTDPLPWEEGIPTQSTTRWLTDPWVHIPLLSDNSQWSSGEKSSLHWWQTTRLTGPIIAACNQYIQYLLTGANPTVFNRHRRGLQP
jgi:hypothetical protein